MIWSLLHSPESFLDIVFLSPTFHPYCTLIMRSIGFMCNNQTMVSCWVIENIVYIEHWVVYGSWTIFSHNYREKVVYKGRWRKLSSQAHCLKRSRVHQNLSLTTIIFSWSACHSFRTLLQDNSLPVLCKLVSSLISNYSYHLKGADFEYHCTFNYLEITFNRSSRLFVINSGALHYNYAVCCVAHTLQKEKTEQVYESVI